MSTIQILTKNNEKTIRDTLESIKKLNFDILVGDLGSSDNTLKICSEYDAEIIDIKYTEDYSKTRNQLIRDGMNFYIEPWEVLLQGHEEIKEYNENVAFYVIRNNIISKETRLWKDCEFINPIYETLKNQGKICDPNLIIVSNPTKTEKINYTDFCKQWIKSRPTNSEPYYYLAFSHLSERRFEEFLFCGEQYLAMDKTLGVSQIMMNYQMAMIELRLNKIESATKRTITCLSLCPTFAEFWCLLGDLLYKQKNYKNSKSIYQNAIIIGKRRLRDDFFPIEIAKYTEYPEKMIKNIESLMSDYSCIAKFNTLEK